MMREKSLSVLLALALVRPATNNLVVEPQFITLGARASAIDWRDPPPAAVRLDVVAG